MRAGNPRGERGRRQAAEEREGPARVRAAQHREGGGPAGWPIRRERGDGPWGRREVGQERRRERVCIFSLNFFIFVWISRKC